MMKLGKKLSKTLQIPKNTAKRLLKVIDKEDIETIISFVSTIILFGVMSNYIAWNLFRLPFTWYSWPSYGFIFILIESKLIKWIRIILNRR